MSAPCSHLTDLRLDPIPDTGCVDCLAIGATWVHLRFCTHCRTVRCCDDSPNRHATAHFRATGHPVIRSAEPGEHWAWCYEDEDAIDTRRG